MRNSLATPRAYRFPRSGVSGAATESSVRRVLSLPKPRSCLSWPRLPLRRSCRLPCGAPAASPAALLPPPLRRSCRLPCGAPAASPAALLPPPLRRSCRLPCGAPAASPAALLPPPLHVRHLAATYPHTKRRICARYQSPSLTTESVSTYTPKHYKETHTHNRTLSRSCLIYLSKQHTQTLPAPVPYSYPCLYLSHSYPYPTPTLKTLCTQHLQLQHCMKTRTGK
jgi:hypothetical protein